MIFFGGWKLDDIGPSRPVELPTLVRPLFSSDYNVAGGGVDINVQYRKIPVAQEHDDLCDRTSCPVTPGHLDIHATYPLPPITPPGPYTVRMVAKDDSGKELVCVEVDFDVSPFFGSSEDEMYAYLFSSQRERVIQRQYQHEHGTTFYTVPIISHADDARKKSKNGARKIIQ